MRILVFITIVGFGAMNAGAIKNFATDLVTPSETPQVAAALELRCGDAVGLERQHCEEDLRKAFSSGTRDAGDIVRLHCTKFDNGWVADEGRADVCALVREG